MFHNYQISLENTVNLNSRLLKGEIFKIFGKGGEAYMGGLYNPLKTMDSQLSIETDVIEKYVRLKWKKES